MAVISTLSETPPVAAAATELDAAGLDALTALFRRSRRLLVLTGAGCSTESGIPDYRDVDGGWKRTQPMQFREFSSDPSARRRYWARSLFGWERVASARPNAGHDALARLEAAGFVHWLVTQNVDGLHHKAGSCNVIELHGRLDRVTCLDCGDTLPREAFQTELARRNPQWRRRGLERIAPDGDVDLEDVDYERFQVPECHACTGILKPDVVFFGESVPRGRVAHAFARLDESSALLVAGSSLMVWSGYRFARAARERDLPVAVVNLGRTRADGEVTLKVEGRCGAVLQAVAARLGI
ncbi:MAG: NAD-dependent protein deacetylase [Gammaproteobacteria bacterium]|nr:NAD-dependent protein deacetylase [Gammaproteobacteria bacterium]NIR85311.1 NAD-dependent protein deacetylase [Gammaproteobacteria bacterium]NIR88427.1 NAD-dependent protein deacetylase [Gammaproteobacteria bacterium]NIU06377.1 NAD-dependent protein deacetylase [Gammaproteobacteria bacterium]NIV53276.1 NAD-dependent protein deacetylase [Gammaproteobacteria bacterium]